MNAARRWSTYDACAAVEGFDGQQHDEAELTEAWQHLIDTGAAWSLQGWYGRQAVQLIAAGVCQPGPCKREARS